MSLTVVYNRNGKRITISKKLAEALKLIDTAQLSFVIDAGVILLGKVTSENKDERIELALKDERNTIQGGVTGKKISYNADAAYGIATGFNLDYSKKSSISFDKIEIDSSDAENPIAVIKAEIDSLLTGEIATDYMLKSKIELINEKIRLLYVGITRAKEMLILSCSSYNDEADIGKRNKEQKPSLYLRELEKHIALKRS